MDLAWTSLPMFAAESALVQPHPGYTGRAGTIIKTRPHRIMQQQ